MTALLQLAQRLEELVVGRSRTVRCSLPVSTECLWSCWKASDERNFSLESNLGQGELMGGWTDETVSTETVCPHHSTWVSGR